MSAPLTRMTLDSIQPEQRVAYVPMHAHDDMTHPDVEFGTVSSKNHRFAFVRFDRQVSKLGWQGTTSQSCDPSDLVAI